MWCWLCSDFDLLQRYLENNEHYKPGGPVFILVGGEWSDIFPPILLSKNGSYYNDLAKEHNAILFCNEHRYYGKTRPFPDNSIQNLQYNNLDQSLADTAEFIRFIKKTRSELQDAKIILLGLSYSGGLVTWFQHLYPGLVDGAWSSSGVVIAKADYYGKYPRFNYFIIPYLFGVEP